MKIVLATVVFGLSFICSTVCDDSQWIIIEDVGIENQYFEFQFSKLTRGKTGFDDETIRDQDNFFHMNLADREAVCLKLKNTAVYRRVPLKMKFPDPWSVGAVSENGGNEENVAYTYRPLKSQLGMRLGEILVFPCQTHADRTYWLTYGYSAASIYLLQEVDDGEAVSFVGVGERVLSVDEGLPQGDVLDAYFMMAYKKRPSWDYRNADERNPFASSALFRLCCLVHAARQRTHAEKQSSLTMNFANSDPIDRNYPPVELHWPGVDQYENIKEPGLVGCAVNRKEFGDFDFFIHPDENYTLALFVLEKKTDRVGADAKLFVTKRLSVVPPHDRLSFYHLYV